MHKQKQQFQNRLVIYRRRMGFSQKRVALLLGFQDSSQLSHYEKGHALPGLVTALRLGIILRVPVEFLYPALYDSARNQIRAEEERLSS